MARVAIHFDMMCPWAYQGSIWIRDAAAVRGLDIEWRFFSLEERNWQPGQKHPWERPWSYSWSLLRIAAYARRELGGNDAVDAFYAAAGRRIHEHGRAAHTPEGARAAVAELGWDTAIVDAAVADEATNEAVLAEHTAAVDLGVYGVPSFVIDGAVFFGPVIAQAPRGEDAGRLWDAVRTLASMPTLYELQRPKSAADHDLIKRVFAPYSKATAATHRSRRTGGAA